MSKYINLFEEILDKVKVSVEVGLKPNFEMLKACFGSTFKNFGLVAFLAFGNPAARV